MNRCTKQFTGVVFAYCVSMAPVAAAEVWTGPTVQFTKTAFADPALEANQDRITDQVWLTRGNREGIFNARTEVSHTMELSPEDTEWAFAGLEGNPTGAAFGADQFATLNFQPWAPSLGGMSFLQDNIPDRPGVVHLISEDIYVDIIFTAWGGGTSGGSFSYERSSPQSPEAPLPVPLPSWSMALMALAVLGYVFRTRQRARWL